MPRVLLVGGAVGGGGAEARMALVGRHMFAGGGEVAVLRTDLGAAPKGLRLHDLGWSGPRSYLSVAVRLRRLLRNGGFDVAMGFGVHAIILTWLATLGLRRRPATVAMEITRPQAEQALWPRTPRTLLMAWLRRQACRAADVLAANSDDGVRECVEFLGVDPARTWRVHNILPASELRARAEAPAPEIEREPVDALRFCMMGRLDPMKRIDTVVEALAGAGPALPWRLWVIGAGEAASELVALAKARGVEERVRFLGWQSEPHRIVRHADALVLASTYEGYSNGVIEAMALGVPVLTSFCSADARWMVETGAAAGFPAGDVEALRGLLVRFAADRPWREGLAQNATRYIAPLEPENAIAGYERAVELALERRRARP